MGQTQRLSPMTAYYLRKLLETKSDRLAWKYPHQTGPLSLDNILQQPSDESTVPAEVLDRLVILHQSLTGAYQSDSPQVQDIETKIFDGLGIKTGDGNRSTGTQSAQTTPRTGRDVINQFNELRKKSVHLLGPTITHRYLLEARPDHNWCQLFKVSEQGPISFEGNLLAELKELQIQLYLEWVHSFVNRCSTVIADFDSSESTDPEESLFSNTLWG